MALLLSWNHRNNLKPWTIKEQCNSFLWVLEPIAITRSLGSPIYLLATGLTVMFLLLLLRQLWQQVLSSYLLGSHIAWLQFSLLFPYLAGLRVFLRQPEETHTRTQKANSYLLTIHLMIIDLLHFIILHKGLKRQYIKMLKKNFKHSHTL